MCFRFGLEDHFIELFPKTGTLENKVHWNTEKPKTCAYRSMKIDKKSENSTDERNPQRIYVSMAHTSINAESPRRYYDDILQQTNWILESGETYHTTLDISYFIPGLLVETDKSTKVANWNFVTAKQTVEV